MSRVLDKNYYPMPFPGGSSMVKSEASGDNTLETHEFYNLDGKVIFYWKLLKDADGNLISFRLKVPDKPAAATGTYKSFDSLT